jgi:hypothetical protein
MGKVVMDRPITPHEAEIIRWMLEHAAVGDVTAYAALPLEELHVIGKCDCGCISLYFPTKASGRYTMIGDAMAVYSDGQQANLILWGRDGEVAWMEVDDAHPDSSHRVPEIADLCTWEDLFERVAALKR